MHALWGLGQMMFTKILLIVDHDVNVQDLSEVTWVVGNHIDPKRDAIFQKARGCPGPCCPRHGLWLQDGHRCDRKWRSEGFEARMARCHRDGRQNQAVHRLDLGETRDMNLRFSTSDSAMSPRSKIQNLTSKITDYGRLIRFSHTVFALHLLSPPSLLPGHLIRSLFAVFAGF